MKRYKRGFEDSRRQGFNGRFRTIACKMTNDNSDIKPPLLVVDAERFYRSGEKYDAKHEIRISKFETNPKFECSNDKNKGKNIPKASPYCRLYCMLDIDQLLFEILNFDHSDLFRIYPVHGCFARASDFEFSVQSTFCPLLGGFLRPPAMRVEYH